MKIEDMLNKSYGEDLQGQSRKFICWIFCREVYDLLGLQLHHFFHERKLIRINTPIVPCIVLFRIGANWHSGIVWPDGLHFIHASTKNIFDPNQQEYIVRKDRLTVWPYKSLIEGYYVP